MQFSNEKIFILLLFLTPLARAQDTIPYTQRRLLYPAWSSTVKGDYRMVGMAGAMVGLANTKLSTIDNPAGLAMTMNDTGIEFSRNLVRDQHIQLSDQIEFTDFSAAASLYPWGIGYAAWTPLIESKQYQTGGATVVEPRIETTEYRFTVSRVLYRNKLSLGLSLLFARSIQSLRLPASNLNYEASTTAWSASLGAMIKFPRRWLLGFSYHFPFTTSNDLLGTTTGITNFFQPTHSPGRFGIGASWIPNRYFQFATSLYLIGKSNNVALLRSENARVGQAFTFQPRVGAIYQWVDYKEFEAQWALGLYYEITRISDQSDRPHFTTGLKIKPWVLNFGWTIDIASGFSNHIFTAGVDVGKIFKKLGFIPRGYQPPRAGLFSSPFHLSDHGLPRALVKKWKKRRSTSLIETGKKLPQNFEKGLKNTTKEIEGFFNAIGNIPEKISDGMKRIKNENKTKSKKKKRRKKKRRSRTNKKQ